MPQRSRAGIINRKVSVVHVPAQRSTTSHKLNDIRTPPNEQSIRRDHLGKFGKAPSRDGYRVDKMLYPGTR